MHLSGFKTFKLYFLAHSKRLGSEKMATCLNVLVNFVVTYIRVSRRSDMQTLAKISFCSPSLVNSGLTLTQVAIINKS